MTKSLTQDDPDHQNVIDTIGLCGANILPQNFYVIMSV